MTTNADIHSLSLERLHRLARQFPEVGYIGPIANSLQVLEDASNGKRPWPDAQTALDNLVDEITLLLGDGDTGAEEE